MMTATFIAECPEGHQDTVRGPCGRSSRKFSFACPSYHKRPWYCCWSEDKSISQYCKFLRPVIKPSLGKYMIQRSDCAACKALSQQGGLMNEISRQKAEKARRATIAHTWNEPPPLRPHQPRSLSCQDERQFPQERGHRGDRDPRSARDISINEERPGLGKWSEKKQPCDNYVDASIALDSQLLESNSLIPMLYQERRANYGYCSPPTVHILDCLTSEIKPKVGSRHRSECEYSHNILPMCLSDEIDEPYVHLGLDEARWTQIQEGAGHGTVPPPPCEPLPSLPQETQPHVGSRIQTTSYLAHHAHRAKPISPPPDEKSQSLQTSHMKQVSSNTSPTSCLPSPPTRNVSTIASMLSIRSRLTRSVTLETRIEMDNFLRFWSL
ncbi:hypothetical protein K3495_g1936 [Podosphaera aphanis]|nr:hypothetical protein K3495_g1936 [Podosphaera aphanis]